MFFCKIFFILTKRVREPNFCEPKFCELNFCEPSSQISGEPVNHGSQITPAPKNVVIFWCNLCSINTKNLMLMAAFVRTFYQNVFMDAEAYLRQLYYFELKIYPLASNELLMFSLACLVRKIYQNQCRRFLVIFDHNVQSYCDPLKWPMGNFIILN